MKRFFVVFTIFFYVFTAFSFESLPYRKVVGPEERLHLAKKIVNVLDHMTVGAVQTTLGAGHIVMYVFLLPVLEGRLPEFNIHTNNNEVFQIQLDEWSPILGTSYSLGLVQVGRESESHEGGHAVASSTLGPLYLPTVGLDYLIEGRFSSFVEDWANLESLAESYVPTEAVQVGVGEATFGSTKISYVSFNISLDELQVDSEDDVESRKVYQWLKGKILVPLVKESLEKGIASIGLDIDLLKKTLVLQVNLSDYLPYGSQMAIRTEQEYGSVEKNMFEHFFNVKALSWKALYGFDYREVNPNYDAIVEGSFSAGVGANAGSLISYTPALAEVDGINQLNYGLSLIGRADVTFLDYLTLYGTIEKEWARFMSTTTYSLGFNNSGRNPKITRGDLLDSLEFSGEYKYQLRSGGKKLRPLTNIELGVGWRF